MSQYQKLDELIVNALKTAPQTFSGLSCICQIGRETLHLARASGREEFRVLDGRLQALKRAGKIVFGSGAWRLK